MWGLVNLEGRSGSLDNGLDIVHVTHLVPGDHQLLLGLLLPLLHVPVCVGHVALLMLLGFLELPPLHRGHIHLHRRGHDLVTGGHGKDVHVLGSLKDRLGLLDSTSNIGIGGHLVVGVLWRVVSVGSKLLSLLLSDGHLRSNPLGLAVHGGVHDVLVLGLGHVNPLGLGACLVLVAVISGTAGRCSAFCFHGNSSDLSPVLLGDDDGADVEELLIVKTPRTCYLPPPHKYLPHCVENYWESCV